MYNYILRRLFQAFLVIFFLSFLSYALMGMMPGDPVDLMISSDPNIRPEDVERLRRLYGLDTPIYQRYFNWLGTTLTGDFGYSRTYRMPVMDILGERLMNTFYLSMISLVLALLIAIPIGMISALRQGTRFDYISNLLAFAGQSIPQFWLGIIAIMIFSVTWRLLPAGGTESIGANLTGFAYFIDRARYMILPVAVFTVAQIAAYVRFTRGSMIEVLRADYIRTAKAKGLGRGKIIWTHAFRNALLPLVTMVALGLSAVFSGAIITEQVFNYRGVGALLYNAINGNDFNLAMVCFNITTAMVVLTNLVADIAYAFIDPRISYK